MAVTINREFPIEVIERLFDKDQFYVKIFTELLEAVVDDDFSKLSRTPTMIRDLYYSVRAKVSDFINEQIYDQIFSSDAYVGLMNSLIDIYSVCYTVVELRKNISNLEIQPDCVVDAYLAEFGFEGAHLFNYIQRREICRVVYWYLRRKGTPALIIKFLDTLGFSYFYMCEFELCKNFDEDDEGDPTKLVLSDSDKLLFKSNLLYEEVPSKAVTGFYNDITYTYKEIKNIDPFLISESDEVSSNKNMVYPAQSPYYQIGAAVTYTNLERTISAFTYAMIRKTYRNIELGENVFTSRVNDYPGIVSFLSLVLGYTYVFGEYFGVYDMFVYSQVDITDEMQADIDDVKDVVGLGVDNAELADTHKSLTKLYDTSFLSLLYNGRDDFTNIAQNDNISHQYNYGDPDYPGSFGGTGYAHISGDTGSSIEDVAINSEDGLYKLDRMVFGWTKDITNVAPLDIMYDIDTNISELCSNLQWYPPDPKDASITKLENTVRYRKNQNLQKIKELFYSPPIFNTYENAVEVLTSHDPSFKKFLDSVMFSKEKRAQLMRTDEGVEEVRKNFSRVITLIDDILEAIEYFIFDNTTFMIPVKSLVMSYSRAMKIITELDKYYAPYNAKLINPMIVWLIRDLPGDIVAIDDTMRSESTIGAIKDVLWRADNYEMLDIAPPEPYAPISDFSSDGTMGDEYRVMPHVPTNYPGAVIDEGKYLLREFNGELMAADHSYFFPSDSEGVKYTDKPLYNTEEELAKNPFLYAVGYNWLRMRYDNLIVNGRKYQSKYDWCPDKLKTDLTSKVFSGFNICKPDQKRLKELDIIRRKILERKSNVAWFDSQLESGDSTYTITHNLSSTNIKVFVFDSETGVELFPEIRRLNLNKVQLEFESTLETNCTVCAVGSTTDDVENNTTTQLYDIVGNGYIDQYIIPHNLGTRNVFCEAYDRNTGELITNYSTRRLANSLCIRFDGPLSVNTRLRLNLYAYTPKSIVRREPVDMLYYVETVQVTDEQKKFVIEHNFYNNNFMTVVYSPSTSYNVAANVTRISRTAVEVDFSIFDNGTYRIVLFGCVNRQISGIAVPLNNIVAFSSTITGNGRNKVFSIQHNLGTLDTFEQVFDVENITQVIQLTDTKTLRSTKTKSVVRAAVDHIDENNSKLTFKNAPAAGKKYVIVFFGPLTNNSAFTPSVYYNTYAKSFTLVSSNSPTKEFTKFPEYDQSELVYPQYDDNYVTDYVIQHNFGTESVVAQVFDQHGLRIESIIEILDDNHVRIGLSKSIDENDVYHVNVLSIPNAEKQRASYSQYFKFNFINTFIANIPADCVTDTFSIMHNMNTRNVLVNVFNRKTGETVETYVAINDNNCVTIAFKDAPGSKNHIFDGGYANTVLYDGILDGGNAFTSGQPITYNQVSKEIDDNYFAVIIGCKRSDYMMNDDQRDEMCDILTPMPHFYHEFKTSSTYGKSVHISYDNDYFDSSREYVRDHLVKHRRFNLQSSDTPEIRERIDIIHEIRNSDHDIIMTETETLGFNANDMTTNDFYGGAEVVGDVKAPTLETYKYSINEGNENQ